jgi:perosamine synthetase
MNKSLALFGGSKIRLTPYPLHRTTGEEEKQAVLRVLESGVLSGFEGTHNEFFRGGREVKSLEAEWSEKFHVRNTVAFNSATSGLMAAVAAVGAGPGDEVIVTPFTMSGTVAGILANNAIPVFADIELATFNLDPLAVERRLTKRTKAILPVHIFGHPAPMGPLLDLARKHRIAVIEDAAQAPSARYHGRFAGTLGDIGVFSLNCNKHIQCGEGGLAVTNDDTLADRLRLIRNHAEAVIASGMPVRSLKNMLGFNLRMTELEAAVARSQMLKLDDLIARRLELVDYLNAKLRRFTGLRLPIVQPDCTHVYYRYAVALDQARIRIPASLFVQALNAEGLEFYVSYVKPLYLQPLFQEQIVHGDRGCPIKCPWYDGTPAYE